MADHSVVYYSTNKMQWNFIYAKDVGRCALTKRVFSFYLFLSCVSCYLFSESKHFCLNIILLSLLEGELFETANTNNQNCFIFLVL